MAQSNETLTAPPGLELEGNWDLLEKALSGALDSSEAFSLSGSTGVPSRRRWGTLDSDQSATTMSGSLSLCAPQNSLGSMGSLLSMSMAMPSPSPPTSDSKGSLPMPHQQQQQQQPQSVEPTVSTPGGGSGKGERQQPKGSQTSQHGQKVSTDNISCNSNNNNNNSSHETSPSGVPAAPPGWLGSRQSDSAESPSLLVTLPSSNVRTKGRELLRQMYAEQATHQPPGCLNHDRLRAHGQAMLSAMSGTPAHNKVPSKLSPPQQSSSDSCSPQSTPRMGFGSLTGGPSSPTESLGQAGADGVHAAQPVSGDDSTTDNRGLQQARKQKQTAATNTKQKQMTTRHSNEESRQHLQQTHEQYLMQQLQHLQQQLDEERYRNYLLQQKFYQQRQWPYAAGAAAGAAGYPGASFGARPDDCHACAVCQTLQSGKVSM